MGTYNCKETAIPSVLTRLDNLPPKGSSFIARARREALQDATREAFVVSTASLCEWSFVLLYHHKASRPQTPKLFTQIAQVPIWG